MFPKVKGPTVGDTVAALAVSETPILSPKRSLAAAAAERVSPAVEVRNNKSGYSRGLHSITLCGFHLLNSGLLLRLPLANLCSSSWFFQLELCLLLYSSWFLSTYVLGSACKRPVGALRRNFVSEHSPRNSDSNDASPSPRHDHYHQPLTSTPSSSGVGSSSKKQPLELTDKQRSYMISTFRAMSYVAVFVGASLLLGICIIIGFEFSNTLEDSYTTDRNVLDSSSSCDCKVLAPRIPILRYPTLVALGGITIFLFVNSCWICWNVERILSLELAALNARDAAEEANKAKSNFLSFLAHELRNPLHAILGVVHLLGSMEGLSMFQRENVDAINSCCRLMCTVLDDVLDMSKIESGLMKFESLEFSLQKFLKEIAQFGKMTTSSKGLKWFCELVNHFDANPCREIMLTGDPTRLKQCLFNLITNGVKFTSQGCVTLNVYIPPSNNHNGKATLKFVVSDEGTGIPAESLNSIFKSYTQANLSISRTHGGSGLGLAIVKQLVNQMNGEVSVHSEVGVGSVFSIEVPIQARSEIVESVGNSSNECKNDSLTSQQLTSIQQHALQSMSEISVPSRRSSGMKNSDNPSSTKSKKLQTHCLLVEDNELNRVVASMVLEQAGIKVTTANDGVDAVELWNRTPQPNDEFDVILMDLTMPRQNGIETAKILRDQGCKSIIIALTAHATDSERQKCSEAGMENFLTKPLRPEAFLDVLKRTTEQAD